jgi:putative DNA base modification enzyme with NMAD domain
MAYGTIGRDPEMSRIWRYVLATDNGMAPCAEQGILSLCLCKPMIRRSAGVGEWVVGFVPRRINGGRVHVAWAGQIAESVSMGDYEKRFPGRRDAIYRLVESKWGEPDILVPLRDDYHADERNRSRDRKGKNVLIFRAFWYWGSVGINAPDEIVDLAHYYVGQSTKNSSPEKIARLEAWLRSVAEPGIHGEPRDQLRTRPPQ